MITEEQATEIATKYLVEKWDDLDTVDSVIFSIEEEYTEEYEDLFHYIKDSVEDYIGHYSASFEPMEDISWFIMISARTGEVWGCSTPHGIKNF